MILSSTKSPIELIEIIFSIISGLDLKILQTGTLSCKDWYKLAYSLEILSNINNLHIISEQDLTTKTIILYCNELCLLNTPKKLEYILINDVNLIKTNTTKLIEQFNFEKFLEKLSNKHIAKVIIVNNDVE